MTALDLEALERRLEEQGYDVDELDREALRRAFGDDVDEVSGRVHLLGAGAALKPAREIRYLPAEAFDDVTDEELEAGARSLYALSYSCQQGAKALERISRKRRGAET